LTHDDRPEPADVLAFGPHPDDVELCAGGLLIRSLESGYRCVIVDLTRGEAGTRGTPEVRAREARAAAELLGLTARENLGLPDARLQVIPEMEGPVVDAIRRWRPRVVLGPCEQDRHPDHVAAAQLVRRAYYGATIARAAHATLPPHRPDVLIQYFGHLEPQPSFVVDVSAWWEKRMAVARCYASQLGLGEADGPPTNISSPDFMRRLESRYSYWGSRIGADYGEPYLVDRMVPMDDPVAAFRKRGWAVL
jgi:bacillithiol biosynthesis deacetylase BshB1